ncbi:MAG: YjgN family protein [Hyphomicrobiales bacterium]
MVIVNFLLSVITLTFYRFWAKTRVRKHIWSCVFINGQPLEYTGRGGELFKGALYVFAILVLPAVALLAVLNFWLGPDHPSVAGVQALLILGAWVLWGAAHYRARRYRLSRTQWHGIRASLEGSALTYTLTYFAATLARAVTLGWSTPAMNRVLQKQMTGSARFGNLAFRFEGRAGPLYPAYALSWILFIVTSVAIVVAAAAIIGTVLGTDLGRLLGDLFFGRGTGPAEQHLPLIVLGLVAVPGVFFFTIYPAIWSFYTARELAAFASYTSLGNAHFKFDVGAGGIIALGLGNFLIWLLTLGIGAPFIQQRMIRFLCDRLTVLGTVDVNSIRQSTAPVPRKGEGLADAFGIGWL